MCQEKTHEGQVCILLSKHTPILLLVMKNSSFSLVFMIAPGLYAPVHQHFFVARMDMSVDSKPGEALNQVICIELLNVTLIGYALSVSISINKNN